MPITRRGQRDLNHAEQTAREQEALERHGAECAYIADTAEEARDAAEADLRAERAAAAKAR